MLKVSAILLVNLLSFSAYADLGNYYPARFVEKFETGKLKHKRLKKELFKILNSSHIRNQNDRDTLSKTPCRSSNCYSQRDDFSYKSARKILFGELHLERNSKGYFVKDLYCETEIGQDNGVGKGKIPNYKVLNCEHTWPQSRFNPQMSIKLQKTDLHHLYPVNPKSNSTRRNFIFAEVDGKIVNSNCRASYKGKEWQTRRSAFQPPESHRGNVARAIFYFSTRYQLSIDQTEEAYLRKWHREDPVDDQERTRNDNIFKNQFNRNPFIDNEEFVTYIKDF